ncbi:hypothetical protein [Actinomadura sp. 7K534]|uniref:hypothetical protein n=1 Tax=Actinomadura sp. 7K534 TaxID=2530366 RepID=UPI0010538899|nr:hypothetical protein [Actinomadura sp. 7K534]TDB98002.1 hypothetical protein E1266_04645 [Actinomadura sp. 7K534]
MRNGNADPAAIERRLLLAGAVLAPVARLTGAQDAAVDMLARAERAVDATEIGAARRLLGQLAAGGGRGLGHSGELRRRYLAVRAVTLRDSGRGRAAVPVYGRLVALGRAARDSGHYGTAVMGAVVSLMNEGRTGCAERVLRAEYSGLAAIDDRRMEIEVAFWQARILEDRGHLAAARELVARRVLAQSAAHENPDMQLARHVFACRLALGTARPDWGAAERYLDLARERLDGRTRALRVGQYLTVQALFEHRAGASDRARTLARNAAGTLTRAGIRSPHLTVVLNALDAH